MWGWEGGYVQVTGFYPAGGGECGIVKRGRAGSQET